MTNKLQLTKDERMSEMSRHAGCLIKAAPIVLLLLVIAGLSSCSFKSIPAGHVGVATLFGEISPETYEPGMHFPVNPLYRWELYDTRQKTHKESATVPSQDQLSTQVDVSVQFRLNGTMANQILAETGTYEQMIEVHLIPKLRSLVREQGKTIKRAEDFFQEETQQQLQVSLSAGLKEYLAPMGLEVQDVLIRDINLPKRLVQQIEQKKEAEQQAERQKAELDRFRTEQQQKIAQAEAERQAAEEEAAMRKVLADAQAYEIEKINQAVANNPAYIQLEALKTLQTISKDPAAKLYFMDGSSPQPLPLMHLGERQGE